MRTSSRPSAGATDEHRLCSSGSPSMSWSKACWSPSSFTELSRMRPQKVRSRSLAAPVPVAETVAGTASPEVRGAGQAPMPPSSTPADIGCGDLREPGIVGVHQDPTPGNTPGLLRRQPRTHHTRRPRSGPRERRSFHMAKFISYGPPRGDCRSPRCADARRPWREARPTCQRSTTRALGGTAGVGSGAGPTARGVGSFEVPSLTAPAGSVEQGLCEGGRGLG